MKVKDLIEGLLKCPQDMTIKIYYDGSPRLIPDFAYFQAKDDWDQEMVVLGEYEDIYNLDGTEEIYFNKSDADPKPE